MNNSKRLLLILIVLGVLGIGHTARVARDLAHCTGCSAPWQIAVLWPGIGYFSLLIIGFISYFFLRKKKKLARILLIFFLLAMGSGVWKFCGESSFQAPQHKKSGRFFWKESRATGSILTLDAFSGNRSAFAEQHLAFQENSQLKYPRKQETYFCGYEEFDSSKKWNQTISYGWQLCGSFFIQDQEIECPQDEAIRNDCFKEGNCSQCRVTSIPKKLITGGWGSYPVRLTFEDNQLIETRIPEDWGADQNGEGGYWNSIKENFSPLAFLKFKTYSTPSVLRDKLNQKAQEHFWITTIASPTFD